MIRRKIYELISFICVIMLILPLVPVKKAQAEIDAKMKRDGNFEFTTTDTAATTSTTWRTIGFTVRRDISEGNPLKDDQWTRFWLQDGQKKEIDNEDGTKTVTFYLTKKQVNTSLAAKGMETIQKGDVLYLNGIFKVSNGTNGEGPYYTLNSIKTAESWKNPNDFNDRFDVKIYYDPGDQTYPVTITYQLYQSNTFNTIEKDEKAQLQTHEKFVTSYQNIPISQEENGEKYYLYRVYYQDIKDKTIRGNRKTEINPNVDYDSYLNEIKTYVRDRTFYMQGTEDGDSLNIVAIYRRFPLAGPASPDEMIKDYEEIDPTGIVGADSKGNEAFDVSEGIPGTETLYTNVTTSKYIAGSKFIRKSGSKYYTVKVTVTYNLSWEEKDPKTGKMVPKSSTVPMSYTYQIQRDYSYWLIDSLGVYAIDKAIVNNDSMAGGSVTLTPSGYSPPTVSYIHSDAEKDHLVEPVESGQTVTVNLGSISVSGDTVPSNDFKSEAEAKVNQIKCKNDNLIFNGVTIMTSAVQEKLTATPSEIPSGSEEISENVLYRPNIFIPGTTANGIYDSTGTVYYKSVAEINPEPIETSVEISDINSVTVHTPTVCDAMIQNNYQDNQMITPDMSRASLVLDRPFYVTLPSTGNHRYITGYGYRDYGKYIASREVSFPFDVYKGSSSNGVFISKNTWTSVAENTQFYLPTWVTEGKYIINYRSAAINAYANNGYANTEILANTSLDNYVATDTTAVEVSGRVYGLSVYDITDYPIWENVFRLPNSLKLTGFKYTVGEKDQNGNITSQNSKYTLALLNGVHPDYPNQGALKTGYMTRFTLKTVGTMNGNNDYIRIKPTFYYVDITGQHRQAVDIYYTESFNGKENIMVKMGSSLDLENKKSIRTGDPYMTIPEQALKQTAYYKGIDLNTWIAQNRKVFTFTNIMIPESLRTFIGYQASVPAGVTEKQIAESVQNWYGEYYIPSEIHVVPKDYDIVGYVKSSGGLTYKEPFWLKNGYVIVNFQIETIKDGERHLSYINPDNAASGFCNMWKREGYQYTKIDNKGNTFQFQDGDYALYYTDKSAAQDYTSAGTH